MRFTLIPESGGGDIRLLGQVTASMSPSQILDGDLQILFETDRIHHMPAVKSETLSCLVGLIGRKDLHQSCIGCGKRCIFSTSVEIIRATEIIFRTGAYYRGKLFVSIHEELDLSFTPPAIVVDLPGHVYTHVMPFTLDTVHDGVIGRAIHLCPTELRMKVGGIIWHVGQRIVDLII